MIGRVEFNERGWTLEAVLESDGSWVCAESPAVAALWNRECAPGAPTGSEDRAHAALIKAARLLHGLAWLGPRRLEDPMGSADYHDG